MGKEIEAMLGEIADNGFKRISQIWKPFVEEGCKVCVKEDTDRPFGIRDDLALHLVGRMFPATSPDKLQLIPVLPDVNDDIMIGRGNLIVLGRIHSFAHRQLSRTLPPAVHKYAHFRFIDNQTIVDLERGTQKERTEKKELKVGYGIIRIWRQDGRNVMNLCGAGAIGTLAATMAVTRLDHPVSREVERRLQQADLESCEFVEILVEGQWKGTPPDRVSTSNLSVEVLGHYAVADEDDKPNLPRLRFLHRPKGSGGGELWQVAHVGASGEEVVLKNLNQVTILAVIAARTQRVPSTAIELGAYVSCEEIANVITNAMETDTSSDTVRTTLGRIRRLLDEPKWSAICPGLILYGAADAGQKKGRKMLKYRLRAQADWEPDDDELWTNILAEELKLSRRLGI